MLQVRHAQVGMGRLRPYLRPCYYKGAPKPFRIKDFGALSEVPGGIEPP